MRAPLTAAHAASLCTTAGITAVITGVLAASLLAQSPPAGARLEGALAGAAVAALVLGAVGLYTARDAIGEALDRGLTGALPARALVLYHLGMAGVFTGMGLGAAWRLALPHGAPGWLAVAVAALAAGRALLQAAAWPPFRSRSRSRNLLPPVGGRDAQSG